MHVQRSLHATRPGTFAAFVVAMKRASRTASFLHRGGKPSSPFQGTTPQPKNGVSLFQQKKNTIQQPNPCECSTPTSRRRRHKSFARVQWKQHIGPVLDS